MQFLKTLFWFLLAIVAVVFAFANWTNVTVNLWAGLKAEINLPVLLIITFLAGLFPTLLYHHAVRWRLRHKLAAAERALADARGATSPSAPLASAEAIEPPAPAAIPGIVPPGGA